MIKNTITKFRAWDGLNKKMSYWTMNDLCTYSEKDEKPNALDEWMQFTGIIDDKGKEVYEGDIVKVWDTQNKPDPDDEEDNKEHYKECLDDAYLCTQVVEKSEYGGYFCEEDNGEYCPPLGSQDDVTVEVIGNIYQNPELKK